MLCGTATRSCTEHLGIEAAAAVVWDCRLSQRRRRQHAVWNASAKRVINAANRKRAMRDHAIKTTAALRRPAACRERCRRAATCFLLSRRANNKDHANWRPGWSSGRDAGAAPLGPAVRHRPQPPRGPSSRSGFRSSREEWPPAGCTAESKQCRHAAPSGCLVDKTVVNATFLENVVSDRIVRVFC